MSKSPKSTFFFCFYLYLGVGWVRLKYGIYIIEPLPQLLIFNKPDLLNEEKILNVILSPSFQQVLASSQTRFAFPLQQWNTFIIFRCADVLILFTGNFYLTTCALSYSVLHYTTKVSYFQIKAKCGSLCHLCHQPPQEA